MDSLFYFYFYSVSKDDTFDYNLQELCSMYRFLTSSDILENILNP